jgi:uncharacterized repeat protein (TIGR04076 family)
MTNNKCNEKEVCDICPNVGVPQGICPHAYHILSQYLLTIRDGGWFSWVRGERGVVAQCPKQGGPVFEIFRDGLVKVIGGHCEKYKFGKDYNFRDAYNGIEQFELDYFKSIRPNHVCRPDSFWFKARVACMDKDCRYHKRLGQEYDFAALAPHGLCRTLYYFAYPTCLAMLYGARYTQKDVKCPFCETVVRVEVDSLFPRYLRMPFGIVNTRIKLTIIAAGEKYPYKLGYVYHMNLRGTDELCPCAFHMMYPLLDSNVKNLHCPDDVGMLYEVMR